MRIEVVSKIKIRTRVIGQQSSYITSVQDLFEFSETGQFMILVLNLKRFCKKNMIGQGKCVIFFDELDSLCPKRGSDNNTSSERVVN